MDRCNSQASSLSTGKDICRICHCEGDSEMGLIAPCYCAGSLRYVHQDCLQQWIKSSDTKCCELCKFNFIMQSKIKPFCRWEKLEMSRAERRKLSCSVGFHLLALMCVVWSMYVLIERTAQDFSNGMVHWAFWTKLIVVAIGAIGGVVFMYVQCKVYTQLCKRWKAFNRVIYVQNAPEKLPIQNSNASDDKLNNHKDSTTETPNTFNIFSGGGGEDKKTKMENSAKTFFGFSLSKPVIEDNSEVGIIEEPSQGDDKDSLSFVVAPSHISDLPDDRGDEGEDTSKGEEDCSLTGAVGGVEPHVILVSEFATTNLRRESTESTASSVDAIHIHSGKLDP